MDEREEEHRERMDNLMDGVMFWLSVLLAILFSTVILFAGGWLFQVPFGDKTSSEYIDQWKAPFEHPEETALGRWVNDTLKRVKN
jgi:hypothetical protein